MISAIVFVSDTRRHGAARDHELLVRSLSWLVTAVVAGVVYDVTLAGPAALGLADIADQSGCGIAEGEREAECLGRAVAQARYQRLLILESAFQPGDSMIGELETVARGIRSDATVRLLATPATLWQRIRPDRAATVGLFAPATLCRALPNRDFRRLRAGLKPNALFATRASPIF